MLLQDDQKIDECINKSKINNPLFNFNISDSKFCLIALNSKSI